MAVSIGKLLTKVFGSRNERLLKRFRRIVDQVNELEPKVRKMTDDELRARTAELRAGLVAKPGRPATLRIEDVMPEAFAIIRESMDRHIGIREIFNPEQNFDPDKLDDKHLELYDSVQRAMIATGESWQRVAIPHGLYEAVRALHPESRPPFRARPFDVQIIGGLVLSEGKIAEMATGEGKTFVAPLACFLRVLQGMHCHVVTVNDYLVRRDASWVRPAFENLGMSVGYIQSDMDPGSESRRKQYACDVTYGTNSEFGFDFLRDNMKERADLQVQGPLDYAIVDEVDSILIDEARTPLIISGAAHDDAPKYRRADEVARKVIELNKPWTQAEKAVDAAKRAIKSAEGDEDKAKDKADKEKARQRKAAAEKQLEEAEKRKEGLTQYYEVELDRKSVHLTHEGIAAAQDAAGVGSFYVGNNMEWPHLMEQAMRAHVVYERDKDYVVERGKRTGDMEVIIVDEYTGRKMEGRQWSDGLHQAIEAKERVPIKQETQTLATITLQNFFKLYKALSGMTGTAQTEAEEFMKIYRLEVVTIPTNRPVIRQDNEDRIYRTEPEKWEAIIEEIKEASDAGRPVLVGTTSVEKSEMLSNRLKQKYGVQHEVLNAKYHEREATIVQIAGQQHKNVHGETVGNVTIATNMAGRGTDIKLGEGVADLSPAEERLEPLRVGGVVWSPLGEWREGDRVVIEDDWLDDVRPDELLEQLVDDLRPDRVGRDVGTGRAGGGQQRRLLGMVDIIDATAIDDRLAQGLARPWGRHLDRLAAPSKARLAVDRDGGGDDQRLDDPHHVGVVGVGLVELQHRELRRVEAVDALVAEVLADLVDALIAADDQPLQVELVGDAQVEGLVERVVPRREGPRRGAAVERLEGRRLHLEVAVPVQLTPERRDDPGAGDEHLPDLVVTEQVGVAAPVAGLDVGQAVPLLRRSVERLAQHPDRRDAEGHLAGPGPEQLAGRLDEVAEVVEPEDVLERLVAEVVLAQVELQAPGAVLDRHEQALAHLPLGDDPADHGDRLRQVPVGVEATRLGRLGDGECLQRCCGRVSPLGGGGVGVMPLLAEPGDLGETDLLQFGEGHRAS